MKEDVLLKMVFVISIMAICFGIFTQNTSAIISSIIGLFSAFTIVLLKELDKKGK